MQTAQQQRNGKVNYDEPRRIPEPDGAAVLARSIETAELKIQMEQSRSWPRSIKEFVARAEDMATLNEDVAAGCFYSVPRAGTQIEGPSVRLAEICALAWGNLRYGSKVVAINEREVVAEGFCHDMEMNNQCSAQVQRRIVGKGGNRFGDDMIQVTCNAAASIAMRNAIFRVVPKIYVDMIAEKCRKVVAGDVQTLAKRRGVAVDFLKRYGITAQRICDALKRKGIEDITCDDMVTLKGMTTALVEKTASPEEIFPEPEKPKSIKDIGKKPARTESDHQPTDPPPPDEQMGETVDPDELAVLDRIGELSRKLGMSEQQAASEQAAYFKTRGIKDATVSALRAYADSLEGRMERE